MDLPQQILWTTCQYKNADNDKILLHIIYQKLKLLVYIDNKSLHVGGVYMSVFINWLTSITLKPIKNLCMNVWWWFAQAEV